MSQAELRSFLHDLAHDIANWQTRVNQYRDKLDTTYQDDALLHDDFEMLDKEVTGIQADLKLLQQRETLAGDVSLSNALDLLNWELSDIAAELNNYMEEFTSPTLRAHAKVWLHAVMDTRREAGRYMTRFLGHTLKAAYEADAALAHGCGKTGSSTPTRR